MTTTLTRIAMAAPIVAALLALTSGWAEAKTGPNFPGDITTNSPIVDPQPQPPKWQHVPDIDLGDIAVDPDPQPPADDPAPPADTDDSDGDDNGSHGNVPAPSNSGASHQGTSVPAAADTDTAFDTTAAGDTSEQIAPKFVSAGTQQVPAGLVFGLGALLVAIIGWAAYRHHRLSV